MTSFSFFRRGASLTLVALLAACAGDSITEPTLRAPRLTGEAPPPSGRVDLCKNGGSGTYNFQVRDENVGTLIGTPIVPTTESQRRHEIPVMSGECRTIWTPLDWRLEGMVITELGAADPDSITVDYVNLIDNSSSHSVITGQDSVYLEVISGKVFTVMFWNPEPPPPSGGEGCTPGYWKQTQHFGSWTGYTTSQSWHTVFGLTSAQTGLSSSLTLLGALKLGGGDANALARHSTAALLNAASGPVDYYLGTAGVIAATQAAFLTGGSAIGTQKDIFDAQNNAGCELGRAD